MKKKIFIIIILLILFFTCIIFSLNVFINNSTEDNYKDWVYDKNEYPKSEYTLDELPVSHKSAYEVRQFFKDSDTDNDGILKEQEINAFDYKIKHSQYTYNGPYGYK